MATRSNFESVDAYIASQPADVQAVLSRLRAIIRKTLPGAQEVISYQIPAYKLDGATVIFFAGYKNHYSIYPAGGALVAAFKKDLAPPIETSNKGTIRFPLSEPIPVKLIERIAKFRAKETLAKSKEKQKAKTAAKSTAKAKPKSKSKSKSKKAPSRK